MYRKEGDCCESSNPSLYFSTYLLYYESLPPLSPLQFICHPSIVRSGRIFKYISRSATLLARETRDRGHPLEADCGGSERRQWSRGSPLEVTLPNQRKNRDPSREVPRDRQFLTNSSSFLQSEREAGRERCDRLRSTRDSRRRDASFFFLDRSIDRSFVLDPRENLPDLGPERDARRFIGSGRKRGTREGGWRRIIIQWRRGGYLHSTYNIFEQ